VAKANKDTGKAVVQPTVPEVALGPVLQPTGTVTAAELLVAQQLKITNRELERERWAEAKALELNKSCAQRTQEIADQLFADGKRRFRVSVPQDNAQPVIEVSANSPEEAQGRYAKLCGIRSCEKEYAVVDVAEPNAAAAPGGWERDDGGKTFDDEFRG